MSRIQLLPSTATAITLVRASVVSHLDYCNSFLTGIPLFVLTPFSSQCGPVKI